MKFPGIIKIISILMILARMMFSPCQAETFAVILNEGNTYGDLPKNEAKQILRRIYLKQQRNWPGGSEVIFFSRPEGSIEETSFRRHILNMTDSELSSYWLLMKQKKGENPPRAVGSSWILFRQILRKPGAVAVVRKSDVSDAHENIRVFLEFESSVE